MEAYDAVVVGSGAAGCWAAKELTEGGLRVALLEAGRPVSESDFPKESAPELGMLTRLKLALGSHPIQARNPAFSARTRQFYVSDREHPYTTAKGTRFLWFRGRQLGGRLHTWARAALRMSDHELQPTDDFGAERRWPIRYADLAPYYDKVERTL